MSLPAANPPTNNSPTKNSPTRAAITARVVGAREVAPRHFQLCLQAPALAQGARPGQFVHLLARPNAPDWSFDPLLRRAFSILDADAAAGTFEILFRVEGRGTALLAAARGGDALDLIGPLGQPFDLSPFGFPPSGASFHVKRSAAPLRAILVGGGVGVPPLIFLGKILVSGGVKAKALVGARSAPEIIGQTGWKALDIECEVATDDGSAGHRGRVTELLQSELKRSELKRSELKRAARAIVYACGPTPMLRAVAALCRTFGLRCQVSLEEAMPCGIGVCNGCVVRAKGPLAQGPSGSADDLERLGDEWSPHQCYRRLCVEGPACWADEIEWEEMEQ